MLHHFTTAAVPVVQALLASIAADPNAPVDSLCFVTEAERCVLLRTFNASQLAPSELMHPGQTIHGMLEHWAAATPDAPAVWFEARTWPDKVVAVGLIFML